MQNINELFEVVVEYVYSDGDSPFLLPISKGEIVEVIQKELKQYTIEKDGVVIKIPSSYLRPYQSESSTDTSYDYNTQSGQSSKAELENKQNDIDNNISTPQSTHILLNSNGLNETKHSDDEHINRNEISHEENQIDVYEQQLSTNQQDTRNVTLEQLQEQIFEIDSLIESDASLQTIFTKFAEVLRGDKLVIIGDESEIADELREFAEKTTNNVIKVIQKNVKTAVDIDACIESGLVSEMVDLSKSAPATGITMKMIELIWQMCLRSKFSQTHKMFELKVAESLFSMVGQSSRFVTVHIIKILTNITKKGWKTANVQQALSTNSQSEQKSNQTQQFKQGIPLQVKQKSPFQTQQVSPHFNLQSSQFSSPQESYYPIIKQYSSTLTHPSNYPSQSQIYNQKQNQQHQIIKPMSFNQLPQKLQSLLVIPHPYLVTFEQQGIINGLIDKILLDNDIRAYEKNLTCELLDSIYQEGAKLPQQVQQIIIINLNQQITSISRRMKNQRMQIKMSSSRNDTEMNSVHVLQALAFLAVNKENHNTIVESGFIYVAVEFIRKEVEGHKVEPEIIKLCLQIFQMLFLYGTITTQQLIHQQIESNTLEILKNIPEYETEAKILESAFSDPVTMENLMKIRRSVENKNYEYLIEIIRSGLLTVLNIGIEQAIDQGSCFEGKLGIIVEIFLCLIRDNKDACKIVIEETYFIERYLGLLNTIKLNIIKPSYLYPLQVPFKNIPIKQQLQLYNKGTIETMSIMIGSLDESVRLIATDIIGNIVISGVEGIKAGQKHPFHERLSSDGTINRLIDIFNDINKEDIHFYIKRILVFLFKAAALPSQIVLYVIKELKQWNDFKEIALLAECEANHDIILKNNYEKLLLQEEFGEWETLNQLVLIHTILRFGKDENKRKVAIAVQPKVEKLTNQSYVVELEQSKNWQFGQKDNIILKAQKTNQMISKIINDAAKEKRKQQELAELEEKQKQEKQDQQENQKEQLSSVSDSSSDESSFDEEKNEKRKKKHNKKRNSKQRSLDREKDQKKNKKEIQKEKENDRLKINSKEVINQNANNIEKSSEKGKEIDNKRRSQQNINEKEIDSNNHQERKKIKDNVQRNKNEKSNEYSNENNQVINNGKDEYYGQEKQQEQQKDKRKSQQQMNQKLVNKQKFKLKTNQKDHEKQKLIGNSGIGKENENENEIQIQKLFKSNSINIIHSKSPLHPTSSSPLYPTSLSPNRPHSLLVQSPSQPVYTSLYSKQLHSSSSNQLQHPNSQSPGKPHYLLIHPISQSPQHQTSSSPLNSISSSQLNSTSLSPLYPISKSPIKPQSLLDHSPLQQVDSSLSQQLPSQLVYLQQTHILTDPTQSPTKNSIRNPSQYPHLQMQNYSSTKFTSSHDSSSPFFRSSSVLSFSSSKADLNEDWYLIDKIENDEELLIVINEEYQQEQNVDELNKKKQIQQSQNIYQSNIQCQSINNNGHIPSKSSLSIYANMISNDDWFLVNKKEEKESIKKTNHF